ncbi:uncharacterized protein V1510DRAFT_432474 [Dipodascopsis tothii]|uniref:uncharacterized protein n=1 Tax=Dipodascopsis tothii TaxID=44089 RepID=UPI0034CF87A3
MLVPPTKADWAGRTPDPSQLRNKKFLGSGKTSEIDPTWTESAAERRKRVGEEMLGQRPRAAAAAPAAPAEDREEMDRRVREYNAKHRGKSLVEQYREGAGQTPERQPDDPRKRKFDHEKDIVGRHVSASQIDDMAARAAGMDSRFSRGKYL